MCSLFGDIQPEVVVVVIVVVAAVVFLFAYIFDAATRWLPVRFPNGSRQRVVCISMQFRMLR